MILGVDFDNTIVCYDHLFHKVALEQGLIPSDFPVSKTKVRDYLRQCDKENLWIEMQGFVYGDCMQDALPFPGVLNFFTFCKQQHLPVYVISHKTLYPYGGTKYNLHDSAQKWLERHGFYNPSEIGLDRNRVNFVLTKQEKLTLISEFCCTHFIDDLPEFLLEKKFPKNINRILFDPNSIYPSNHELNRLHSWQEIHQYLFNQ